MVQKLLYNYWEHHDSMPYYFMFYLFMEIAIEQNYNEWKKVVAFPRANMHILLERLYDSYDKQVFDHIKELSPIHKLTYKKNNYELFFGNNETEYSNYNYIIKNY